MARKQSAEEFWRWHLTDHPSARVARMMFQRIPSDPRCRLCHTPFGPPGGKVMRVIGRPQSRFNPEICDPCESSLKENIGGAEIEISMLFADVRGSTSLAEQMSASEFGDLIGRFYSACSRVLVNANAMVYTVGGDQVIGYFFPAFAGKNHAVVALQAGLGILRATGHEDPEGPWIPVGVGVHTGIAYCGAAEKAEGLVEHVVLGDSVNTTARLSSEAASGELLVSNATTTAAGFDTQGLENRELTLKGRSEPVSVWSIRVASTAGATQ